jgi:hypothetical protein
MAEGLIAITEGSGKNVSTQTMTIDGETVHIERSSLGVGVVLLPETAQIVEEDTLGFLPTNAVDIQGRYYIIIKNVFNDNLATASYRIAFYDSASELIGMSDVISIKNLGISDGAYYLGSTVVYSNDFCAESIKIYLTEISSSDTITCFIGVV